MKKLLSILLLLAMLVPAMAKADSEPNRMLVAKPNGAFQAYDIERVSEITFATIEGRVACDVDFIACTQTAVDFDVYMDEACTHYLINVLPAVTVMQLEANPAGAEEYMKFMSSPDAQLNGPDCHLSGLELKAGGDYAIVTLGYDKYDCAGEVSAAYFSVPTAPLVGNPTVTATVTGRTLDSITASFTANSDVKGFSFVIYEKDTFESSYEMFASMFGFSSRGDMIKSWGVSYPGGSTQSYTWTDLAPNQEYDIYYMAWDANGTYAPYQKVTTSTMSQGGSGESVITITPGAYRTEQWGDELLPSLYVKFTPNDQTSAFRFNVLLAEDYDEDKAAIQADLQSDPEMPMANWFFYKECEFDYQINPSTEVVIIASGKNVNGEWGRVTELRYTTPAQVSGMPAYAPGVVKQAVPCPAVAPASVAGKARTAPKLVLSK